MLYWVNKKEAYRLGKPPSILSVHNTMPGLPFCGKTFHILIYLLVCHKSDGEDKKGILFYKKTFFSG
jgi:hypothetical protein